MNNTYLQDSDMNLFFLKIKKSKINVKVQLSLKVPLWNCKCSESKRSNRKSVNKRDFFYITEKVNCIGLIS